MCYPIGQIPADKATRMKAAVERKLENAQAKGRANVGRPRVSDVLPSQDPRQDIVEAAARLFSNKGLANVSVREIAAEAGLKKASFYYYFASKDEIVDAMIEGLLDPALAVQKRLGKAPLSEAARLYLYLRLDVEALCAAPYDCTWLIANCDLSDPRFQPYVKQRDHLISWLATRIRKGKTAGFFVDCDGGLIAKAMLSATENSVAWVDRSGPRPITHAAKELAGHLVRGILAPGHDLASVKAEVEEFSI